MINEGESTIITRHGDKGKWAINEGELRGQLSEEEANLVMTVLQEEFADWQETPLKLDGIVRSLRLGDKIFEQFPQKGVLVSTDSGKERAQLTRALVTGRIAQLESKERKEKGEGAKRIDILQIDGKEITTLLADSSDKTWEPYAQMIEKEGISESEALARSFNDLNQPDSNVPADIHPRESAERYRQFVKTIRSRVTSDSTPIVLFGAGHSGSLGQIRYETVGRPVTAEDSPQFCEMFKFSADGKLVGTERVEI